MYFSIALDTQLKDLYRLLGELELSLDWGDLDLWQLSLEHFHCFLLIIFINIHCAGRYWLVWATRRGYQAPSVVAIRLRAGLLRIPHTRFPGLPFDSCSEWFSLWLQDRREESADLCRGSDLCSSPTRPWSRLSGAETEGKSRYIDTRHREHALYVPSLSLPFLPDSPPFAWSRWQPCQVEAL